MIIFHGQPNDTDRIIYDVLKERAALMLTYANCHDSRTSHLRLIQSTIVEIAMKNRKPALDPPDFSIGLETGPCACHFLDSGSFSLWRQVAGKHATPEDPFAFYRGREMRDYLDSYAKFIKQHKLAIDLYANVDVIPNPELSWKNQRYLEKEHGLSPVPVVHYTTPVNWVSHYIDRGYDLIALGGLVGSINKVECRSWIDNCFRVICDTPDRKPKVRIHGFGITSFDMLLRWPWWSVDSTSWTKAGAYGGIYVPHLRGASWEGNTPKGGQFVFDRAPYLLKVSMESPTKSKFNQHFSSSTPKRKAIMKRWLKFINMPLGSIDGDGNVTEIGVYTRHIERRAANLLFFEKVLEHMPDWPWAWRPGDTRKKLGVFDG